MQREFRVSASIYVVFGLLTGVPFLIAVAVSWRTAAALPLMVVAVVLFAFLALWLSRFRLVIGPDAITYSSLLTRERTVLRSEVVFAGPADQTGPLEGSYTFLIRSRAGSELRINAKVFGRDAVAELSALETDRG